MPITLRVTSPFDQRIGDIAAKQPLSGEKVVTNIRVKGFTVTSFIRMEEVKKAS